MQRKPGLSPRIREDLGPRPIDIGSFASSPIQDCDEGSDEDEDDSERWGVGVGGG